MSINPATGEVTAQPVIQGFFTFAIRVEEFRDTTAAGNGPKVKIGEVRRDVQYQSLNCTAGNPPQYLNAIPSNGQTVQIEYNKEYCKDLIFEDINSTDTLFIELISPIFDTQVMGLDTAISQVDGNIIGGNHHYYYNWNGTNWNDSVVIPPNQDSLLINGTDTSYTEWNIGTVATRFCWTPTCQFIDSIFPMQINAFSLGCDGKSLDSVLFNIEVIPPILDLDNGTNNLNNQSIIYNEEHCFDFSFKDTSIVDELKIDIASEIFNLGGTFPSTSNSYLYNGAIQTNVPNNVPNTQAVGTRFCWTPRCEDIDSTYEVVVSLYSTECVNVVPDTVRINYTVTPPNFTIPTPDNKTIPFAQEYCQDVTFQDITIADELNITLSAEFDNSLMSFPTLDNNYEYNGGIITGVPNNSSDVGTVASRFCWTPDCEHIGNTYSIRAILYSEDCSDPARLAQDTTTFTHTVRPPFDSLDVIPTVFTPNGDGHNDFFTLGYTKENGDRVGGTSNPCHDEINVQIFSRWGTLVYESDEYPEFQWDGSNKGGGKVAPGTYFVLISGKYGNEIVTLDQRTVTVLDPK
jgi:gliding motility-associated-like protein